MHQHAEILLRAFGFAEFEQIGHVVIYNPAFGILWFNLITVVFFK
jgi:hypothetical protein